MDEGKAYINIDFHQRKHELELQEKIVKMLKKAEVILKAGKEKV